VGEDLRWEFVDQCEHVSDRSSGAGSFNPAFFGADGLIRQKVKHWTLRRQLGGSGRRGKGSNPYYRA